MAAHRAEQLRRIPRRWQHGYSVASSEAAATVAVPAAVAKASRAALHSSYPIYAAPP